MNEAESPHQPLEFSSLEPTDKVPLHAPTFTHCLHLGLGFLPPVFPADGQAGPDGLEDHGRFDGFGRRDQAHALRVPPRAFGSATDPITDRPDLRCQVIQRSILTKTLSHLSSPYKGEGQNRSSVSHSPPL